MSENFYLDVSLLAVAVGVYATSLNSTNTIIAILLVIFVHQALVKKRLEQREQALSGGASVGTPALSTLDASQSVFIPEDGAPFDAPASFQRSYPAAGPEFDKTDSDTSTASTASASSTASTASATSASSSDPVTAQITYNQPDTRPQPSSDFGPPPGPPPPPPPTGSVPPPVGVHGYRATISDDIVSRNFQNARPSGTQASSMASFYKTMVAGL